MSTSFRQALRAKILAATPITNIVGATGVYSFPAPSDVSPPYIIITFVAGEPINYLKDKSGQYEEFWQLSSFAKTDLECETLKDAIEAQMTLTAPANWSPDGGVTDYFVSISNLGEIAGDIEELDNTGAAVALIQKPLTFRIIRNKTAT